MDLKQFAADQARLWISNNALILDTETTGLDENAEIIEISLLDCKGNALLDTLVKPQGEISPEAAAVHGIQEEDLAFAPTWPEVYRQFCQLTRDRVLAVYNSAFDVRLVNQTSARYELRNPPLNAHCAMKAYAKYYGEWDDRRGSYRWIGLERAAAIEGITIDGNAHRALTDCRTTLEVIKAMAAYRPAIA